MLLVLHIASCLDTCFSLLLIVCCPVWLFFSACSDLTIVNRGMVGTTSCTCCNTTAMLCQVHQNIVFFVASALIYFVSSIQVRALLCSLLLAMMEPSYAPAEILVCQAGSCRRAGSEAVLAEVEELANGLGCIVQASGCMGECSRGPAVAVVRNTREKVFTRVEDVEKSSAVVKQATGITVDLSDSTLVQRLAGARQIRIRRQAQEEMKWNTALAGFAEQIGSNKGNQLLQLTFEFASLLESAGCWEQALEQMTKVSKAIPKNTDVMMACAKLLGKLGRDHELNDISHQIERHFSNFSSNPNLCRAQMQMRAFVAKCTGGEFFYFGSERRIEKYSQWQLESVTKVSKHSAIYRFVSGDCMRGSPNPRGRGRTVWHKTWHTTLLARIGANTEGPLPWIERDYTPISSAKEWESGVCDILIKIYNTGRATSWLHKQPLGSTIWLSQPLKTLSVPSLVPNATDATFKPASYLLILAGSGIVAAPQVLHHTDPSTCFGARGPVLRSPISLIYACRRDDVCLSGSLMAWCKDRQLQRFTLVLTEPLKGQAAPFPEVEDAVVSDLAALANAQVIYSRLSCKLLDNEVKFLSAPCRVVVSGPDSFNSAVRDMLRHNGIRSEAITVLSA